jgi:pyruvate decarboxylase
MSEPIPFATYLVERLKQCGVKYVQGVPGDYNLELVSHSAFVK